MCEPTSRSVCWMAHRSSTFSIKRRPRSTKHIRRSNHSFTPGSDMRTSRDKQDLDRDSTAPGSTGRVRFQDCGVSGEFTAISLGWGRYTLDESESGDEVSAIETVRFEDGAELSVWENGVILG